MKKYTTIVVFSFTLFLIMAPKEVYAGFLLNRRVYLGLNNDLSAYWSFDGTQVVGTTAFDESGNAKDGTLTSGPTRAIGRVGQALDFDGTDDYISVGNVSATVQSVSFWIKADSTTKKIIDLNGTASIEVIGGTITANSFTNSVIYVDGAVQSAIDTGWRHVVVLDGVGINASAVDLGRIGAGNVFDGKLDEVRMYNRALQDSEIKRLYNTGR